VFFCCCTSFYWFAEKHVFVECCIFNISHVSYQVTNTTTISRFVLKKKVCFSTFKSAVLLSLLIIINLLSDCHLIALYYEGAEHIFTEHFIRKYHNFSDHMWLLVLCCSVWDLVRC
jgi:hypothetical protein